MRRLTSRGDGVVILATPRCRRAQPARTRTSPRAARSPTRCARSAISTRARARRRGRWACRASWPSPTGPKQTFGGIVRWLKAVPPMMPDHHLTQDEMDELAAFIMSLRKEP